MLNIEEKLTKSCIKCGEVVKILKKRKNLLTCKNFLCKSRHNAWKNTIFYNMKCRPTEILKVLELYMQKATNNLISYITGVSRKSVSLILKKLAAIIVRSYYANAEPIGGEIVIVQVNESKFGKRKFNRGHHVDGVWVLGSVEKTKERRIRLFVVDDRKAETLTNILSENISEKSTIYTNLWKGYSKLKDKFIKHSTVNHSKFFRDPVKGIDTNTIEGEYCGIKIVVPLRGRTKDKVELYLVRYMILKDSKVYPPDGLLNY